MGEGPSTSKTANLSGRIVSLDGLRGIAAVSVLLTHALLTIPEIYTAFETSAPGGSWEWLITFTPVHIFWAGNEAVYLFFVLSGIVLTIPVLRPGGFSWLSYYPKRLVRLYVPVWGAVLIGYLIVVLLPRGGDESLGWISTRPTEYGLLAVLKDVTLIGATSGVIGPLWSLRLEVYFSLLLPVFIGAVLILRRWWAAKVVALLIMLVVASLLRQDLIFLMLIFAVGVLIVDGWSTIRRVGDGVLAVPGGWPVLIVAGIVLTCSRWIMRGAGLSDDFARHFDFLAILGVSILVVAAVVYPPLRNLLSRRTARWLGRVSFSLYLTHEPILIAIRSAAPGVSPWLTAVIGIALSLVVAELFHRAVERPSHKLAQFVGKRIESTRRSQPEQTSLT